MALVTKVWVQFERKSPLPGYNNVATASCGMAVQLDIDDMQNFDAIMHDVWGQITNNVKYQILSFVGSEAQQDEAKMLTLGMGRTLESSIRPPQQKSERPAFRRDREAFSGNADPLDDEDPPDWIVSEGTE